MMPTFTLKIEILKPQIYLWLLHLKPFVERWIWYLIIQSYTIDTPFHSLRWACVHVGPTGLATVAFLDLVSLIVFISYCSGPNAFLVYCYQGPVDLEIKGQDWPKVRVCLYGLLDLSQSNLGDPGNRSDAWMG